MPGKGEGWASPPSSLDDMQAPQGDGRSHFTSEVSSEVVELARGTLLGGGVRTSYSVLRLHVPLAFRQSFAWSLEVFQRDVGIGLIIQNCCPCRPPIVKRWWFCSNECRLLS